MALRGQGAATGWHIKENAPDEGGVGPEMLSPGGLIFLVYYVDGLRYCQGKLTPGWEGSCDG